MKRVLSALCALVLVFGLVVPAYAAEAETETETAGSILVACFSATNTTRPLAKYAADILGADLYEIAPAQPYTPEDLAYYTGGRADREQNDPSARPAIAGRVEDMAKYDTVLIGYPIWHGQAPRIISTFLESYDFTGKTILPFCTSHSSDIGTSDDALHALAPGANWLEGKRFAAGTGRAEIAAWLDQCGIAAAEQDTAPSTTPAPADPTPVPTTESTPTPAPIKNGWQWDGSVWRYYKNSRMVTNDWLLDKGVWYFLDPDGIMMEGFAQIALGRSDDGWYYFSEKHDGTYGHVMTGWQAIGGSWYYFNPKHNGTFGRMVTNDWLLDKGVWYFLDPDGKIMEGLSEIALGRGDDGLYYFSEKHDGTYGHVMTGWQTIDGNTYYFNPKHNGTFGRAYAGGTYTISGRSYTFDEGGRLTSGASTPETGGLPRLDARETAQVRNLMSMIVLSLGKYGLSDADTVPGTFAIDFLVSYLGREEEALHGSGTSPIGGTSYAIYAYEKGILTNADSGKVGDAAITVADYVTWLLRAMGYASGSDFDSASPLALADSLGLTRGLYAGTETRLIRWIDILYMAKNALNAPCKAGGTLWQAICTDRILYASSTNNWFMNMPIYNPTGGTITLTDVAILDLRPEDGSVESEFHLPGDDPDMLAHNPACASIPAGQAGYFGDAHPVVSGLRSRRYEFTYRTADGGTYVQTYTFIMDHTPYSPIKPDYSGDSSRNLENLRHDAQFQVEVFPGVYWVPASTLGGSRYTNAQITQMLTLSPEEKQAKIGTLYEALQLYKISGFYSSDDNVYQFENGLNWEHHKPGYHAVRTNNGCCAADSDWLRYILDGDYDEVGFLSFSQMHGGHVYNCIQQDGWYYFIDLTCQYQGTDLVAPETGSKEDISHKGTLGNLMRTRDLQAYVDYLQRNMSDPPGLMFLYRAENTVDIASVSRDGKLYITYTDDPAVKITNIFDNPNDQMEFTFAPAPKFEPDWAALPSFDFAKQARLAAAW